MSEAGLPADRHPLQAAVQNALKPVSVNGPHAGPILVGYSGGRDSSVLLHAAVAVTGAANVVAIHINHHLQADANQWQAHTEANARQLGCRYRCVSATAPKTNPPGGIEAWARNFRRTAFVALAREFNARAILLAHHADDQLETILLNLGRGAGPRGVTGMQQRSALSGIALLRPLLNMPAEAIDEYAHRFGLQWIQDPSNADTSLRRNRVRHELLPLMDDIFPGFRGNVLRHARLMKGLDREALASNNAPAGRQFDRRNYRSLSDAALDDLLHRWLRALGRRGPGEARTRHLREQLFRSDAAYAHCQHDGGWLRRYRHRVEWLEQLPAPVMSETRFRWKGEKTVALPAFGGVLHLREAEPGEPGLPVAALADPGLTVSALSMNATMRVSPNGRTRRLRLLCQEHGIPGWERQRLPMLRRGTQVVFAAAFGLNHDFAERAGPERWQIEFRPV